MKKILLILLLPFYIFAVEHSAEYKVTYGMFGTLGIALTKIQRDEHSYKITTRAFTQGLAKTLSGDRQETYISMGEVREGVLLPKEYIKVKSTNKYTKEKRYIFDHEKKEVILETSKTKKKNNETRTHTSKFKYYAPNDILSLYFNLHDLVKDKDDDKFVFYAIGAKEKDGRVDIERPRGKELEEIKKDMKLNSDTFLKVSINQKIFASEKGEMLINVDPNNICTKAILKDVLMFGDIVATKIK